MKKKINIGIIGKNFGIKVILKSFQKNKDTKLGTKIFKKTAQSFNEAFQNQQKNGIYRNLNEKLNRKIEDVPR